MNDNAQRSWFDSAKIKITLDLVNAMDVAMELSDIQKKRTSTVQRTLDALSGKSRRRNDDFQEHLIHGIQACEQFIEDLMASQALQGRALLDLRASLQKTQHHIANLTEYMADSLASIDKRLDQHEARINTLANEVDDIKQEKKAERELELWVIQWKSGELQGLSPLARCYGVLDALYWGYFGAYFLQSDNEEAKHSLRRKLVFEIREQLLKDLNTAADDTLIPRDDWLAMPDSPRQNDITQILRYQGDWSLAAPASARLSFMATQWPMLATEQQREHDRNTYHLIDIKRVSSRMAQEMFEVRQ